MNKVHSRITNSNNKINEWRGVEGKREQTKLYALYPLVINNGLRKELTREEMLCLVFFIFFLYTFNAQIYLDRIINNSNKVTNNE